MNVLLIGKHHNHIIAYAIRFLSSCSLSLPIWALFFTWYIGLSLSEATIVYTIGMITSMIFEVPSGTRADRYGRKRILGIGVLLQALVWWGYLIADTFWTFVGIELIAWFAGALVSGCLISIIYDRYKEQWKESDFQQYSCRHQIMVFVGRAGASIIGSSLFVLSPTLPYQILVSIWIVIGLLTFLLYDPVLSAPHQSVGTVQYIRQGIVYMLQDKKLSTFVLFFLLTWSVCELLRTIYQPLLRGWWMDISLLWWFYAGASLISAGWSYMTKQLYKFRSLDKMFFAKLAIQIWATVLVMILPGWRKLVWFGLIQFVFWLTWPVINHLINSSIPSSHRTTINSLLWLLWSLQRLFFGGIAWTVFELIWAMGIFLVMIVRSVALGMSYILFTRKGK